MIGIMVSVTIVKFLLMVYCRRFKNEIIRAYGQDHCFDVITNSIGLGAAVLAIRYYWWIDPTGAAIVSSYASLPPLPPPYITILLIIGIICCFYSSKNNNDNWIQLLCKLLVSLLFLKLSKSPAAMFSMTKYWHSLYISCF